LIAYSIAGGCLGSAAKVEIMPYRKGRSSWNKRFVSSMCAASPEKNVQQKSRRRQHGAGCANEDGTECQKKDGARMTTSGSAPRWNTDANRCQRCYQERQACIVADIKQLRVVERYQCNTSGPAARVAHASLE
jgi:hypothetical protein